MGIEQTSADLASRIVAMAEVEEDASLNDAEKAEKLKSMKLETLQKINSEIENVTIASKVILENIRTIVNNEEWAKLPPSKKISSDIALNNSVALALQSMESKLTPDIQELLSFYLEIMKRWQMTESKIEITTMGQQWQAIHDQKEASKAAAEAEKTSGIISGACGIATAGLSAIVKIGVTVASVYKYRNAVPKKDMLTKEDGTKVEVDIKKTANKNVIENNEVQGKIEKKNADVLKCEAKISEERLKLEERRSQPKQANETYAGRKQELADRQKTIDSLETELETHKTDLAKLKKEGKVLSQRVAADTAQIDAANNEASRVVQQWRAGNEICDSLFSIIQHGGTIGKAFSDRTAADHKINSEMISYMVNFFSTGMQATKKDEQDIMELQKSLISAFQATLQTELSADSFAIRSLA